MRFENTALAQKALDAILKIEHVSIEVAVKLLTKKVDKVDQGYADEIAAGHLRIVAGCCSARCALDYRTQDELQKLYELRPWERNLFVKEALCEIIARTTLDPASFEALLQLLPACKREIDEAKQRGAIAFPQAEVLLKRAKQLAWDYLYCTSEVEIRDRGFREILDRWIACEDPEISDLVQTIKDRFCRA